MRYRLIVITDGRPGLLEETLRAFLARVSPRPSAVSVIDDSGDEWYRRYLEDLLPEAFPDGTHLVSHPVRRGFCETVADGWQHAANPGVEWVYWLEDDFVHRRPVDLRDLAYVLERQPQVAQMALYRNSVSPEEKRVGGYIRQNPADYARRGSGTAAWLEHRRHWTTNPSLFSRSIPAAYAWPTVEFCEGHFGFELREGRPETTFGIWGTGEPWVEHVGERVGAGY